VEDYAPSAELLGISLRRLGHTVVGVARDGKEALTIAQRLQPEVILMDIDIPGMDGIDTAVKLTEIGTFAVIFSTGRYDDATLKRARVLGPVTYLVKPFSPAQLKAALEMVAGAEPVIA
jgi:CheY-like chemotaxis protein